jgi:DivIVA domain-containing protein
MALSPEDILAKRFQVTKFREGYDQDEVDDYLDEIVVELRKILSENQDLKTQGSPASEVEVEAFPVAVNPPVPLADEDTDASKSIIELAQKLHADHVQEGRVKREQIIRDAQREAARIVRDAEAQAREVLNQLELDRRSVEEAVEDLKRFEAEYRSKLRDYIQGQLEQILSEEAYMDISDEISPATEAEVEYEYYSQEPAPLGTSETPIAEESEESEDSSETDEEESVELEDLTEEEPSEREKRKD